jgi:hypothetical protein
MYTNRFSGIYTFVSINPLLFYHVALQFAITYPVILSVCFPDLLCHVRGFVILLKLYLF